jgi:hypothetical protein
MLAQTLTLFALLAAMIAAPVLAVLVLSYLGLSLAILARLGLRALRGRPLNF